ncbi:MAG: GIY-YIG nuclease family protein [Candidatus Liptonbacteria bacterium]|nr:GIY-YIG nuclease family protein [Candidatus Liptonbacteria bacterium]
MPFAVYILQSITNGRYYIGSTNNVSNRLTYHNSGKVISTKAYIPWKLVKVEEFMTRKEASARELQLKSWKKRVAIEKLIMAPSSSLV